MFCRTVIRFLIIDSLKPDRLCLSHRGTLLPRTSPDMSYRFLKVSAQTDVTSVSPAPPPRFMLMKWVPDVILSLWAHKEEWPMASCPPGVHPLLCCQTPRNAPFSIMLHLLFPHVTKRTEQI